MWKPKKNAKGECAVEGWENLTLAFKNLNNQAMLDGPKTMDSAAVIQAIETNPVNYTGRVSGELNISQFSVVHQLHDLYQKHPELLNCNSYYQNIKKKL